jgi:hypothetical protein
LFYAMEEAGANLNTESSRRPRQSGDCLDDCMCIERLINNLVWNRVENLLQDNCIVYFQSV